MASKEINLSIAFRILLPQNILVYLVHLVHCLKFHIGKNNCLWWQFAELQDELHTVNEKRDNAQKDYRQFSDKTQEQLRMRFTDAAFGRLVVNVRFVLAAMLTEPVSYTHLTLPTIA